ncbi:MAG TPA: SMP-30/gluconolactonase/LRE family protein [Alphaproteobacteria bacterium]|nr:SMP-30/gluconolactonase/LRE family protein [Alphaproteobacteria bacterium]
MAPLIDLAAIRFVGAGLMRPECVLATRAGDLYASDKRGGVIWLEPSGDQTVLGGAPITPNGVAMLRDRSFLVSNLADNGGVWRVRRDGAVEPFVTEIDGVPLGPVNFVWLDHRERVWMCISTIRKGEAVYNRDIRDGFIALKDERGTRMVADDLCFTNECRIDPTGAYLYANETFGQRVSRFRISETGALSDRATLTEFGPGTFPDGMALDSEGALWVVGVIANRLIRVTPDGKQTLMLDDPDPRLDEFDALHRVNRLTRPMLSATRGKVLSNISSIAFGGPDLKTAYLGCLNGDRIATFHAPIAGLPPVHWGW